MPVSRFPLIAVCVLSSLLAVRADGTARWSNVAVQVAEPAGVARSNWPLVVNVPFPRGALRDRSSLSLRRGARGLPTQVQLLASWPDGSVRWVRIDSSISLRPHETAKLTVVRAPGTPPERPLTIAKTARAIEVNTGAVHFRIPRDRFAIADDLGMGRGMAPTIGAITASMVVDHRVRPAGPPSAVEVLEAGPVRGLIELNGPFGPDFSYITRIEVYAGSPFIRVRHTYVKTGGSRGSKLERLSIDVPFATEIAGRYNAGRERGKPLHGELDSGNSVVLAQPDNLYFLRDGEKFDGRLSGWFELAGKKAAVGVAARWFWQEYPKAVSMGTRGITYDLWSPVAPPVNIGIGSAKTHEFVIWLTPRGSIGKAGAPAVARPLRGNVDLGWIASSGALNDGVDPRATDFDETLLQAARRVRKRNAHERWDDCGHEQCGGSIPQVPRTGAYGMLNWGDWNFPGYHDTVKGTDAWGNLEYDTTEVLALTYAATNDPEVFDAMVAAARHFMDVDTVHALPARSEWVGMNHPKNPLHFSFALGGIDIGHTWTEGLVSYYLLTGDARGLQVAKGIADYLTRRLGAVLRGNPRQWGWPQIALLGVYDVTGEARYLSAAQGYARAGMRAHPATGKFHWKLGILADGLAQTHRYAGGAEIEQWLRSYAERVMSQQYDDSRFYPGVAYAAALTNNPQWRTAALRRLKSLDLGSWAKPFSINGRVGARIQSLSHATIGDTRHAPRSSGDRVTTSPPR